MLYWEQLDVKPVPFSHARRSFKYITANISFVKFICRISGHFHNCISSKFRGYNFIVSTLMLIWTGKILEKSRSFRVIFRANAFLGFGTLLWYTATVATFPVLTWAEISTFINTIGSAPVGFVILIQILLFQLSWMNDFLVQRRFSENYLVLSFFIINFVISLCSCDALMEEQQSSK